MKSMLASIIALLTGAMSVPAQQTKHKPLGVIDDTYAVNALGSYNHIIPIHTAPGVNGMEPKLALVYDSRSGLSELGYGWAISGLSKIVRGGNNLAQHGRVDGINFNSSDALLMDGQLLTCIAGTNATVSSQYKTENVSNAIIIASDEQLSQNSRSPRSFTVKQPNGLTYHYGKNDNSIVVLKANGKDEILEWNVSKIEDPHGNYMTFTYEVVNNNSRIVAISYTGNETAGILPKSKVYFRYFEDAQVKRQVSISYFRGNMFQNKSILKSIDIETDGRVFKYYNLEFNAKQDQLISLKECSSQSDDECLPKTLFQYSAPEKLVYSKTDSVNFPRSEVEPGYISFQSTSLGITRTDYAVLLVPKNVRNVYQDLNNDGKNDLIVLTAVQNPGTVYKIESAIYINENGAFRLEKEMTIGTGKGIKKYADIDLNDVLVADFNGDGLADLITQSQLLLNTSNYAKIDFRDTKIDFKEASQLPDNKIVLRTADLDGDLRSEIIVFDYTRKNECSLRIYSIKANAELEKKYDKVHKEVISEAHAPDDIADIDGNGLPDILLKKKTLLQSIFMPTNQKPNDSRQYAFPAGCQPEDRLIDMNLDGYPDIVRIKEGEDPVTWLFDGISFGKERTMPEKLKVKDSREYQFGNFSRYDVFQALIAEKAGPAVIYDIIFSNTACLMPKAEIQLDVKNKLNLYELLEKSSQKLKMKEVGGTGDDIAPYRSNDLLSSYDHDLNGGPELVLNQQEKKADPKSTITVFAHQYYPGQKLTAVQDGFGNLVKIAYTGIKDETVYKTTLKPLRNNYEYYNGSYPVVKTLKYSNGVDKDSLNTVSYSYEDLVVEKNGRGISGFSKVIKNETSIGISETTGYLYEFPLTGKIATQRKTTNDGSVTFFEQTNLWNFRLYNNDGTKSEKIEPTKIYEATTGFSFKKQTYLPILAQTDIIKRELNGETTSHSTVRYRYNDPGFIESSVMTMGDGTLMVNEKTLKDIPYSGEGSLHLLGLVTSEKTFLVGVNNDTSLVRTLHYDHNDLNGSLILKTRQKADEDLKQYEQFGYDNTGNLIKKSVYRNANNKIEEIFNYENTRRYVQSYQNPLGQVTQFKHDRRYGNMTEEISPNNLATRYTFDDFGNLNKIVYPDNTYVTYKFEYLSGLEDAFHKNQSRALYKLTTSTSGAKDFAKYYDMLGREVSSAYSLIDQHTYPEPDIFTNLALSRQAERRVFTHHQFDHKGNIARSFKPAYVQLISDGISTKYACVQFEDSILYATNYSYDHFNRLQQLSLPDGNILKTIYGTNTRTDLDFKGSSKLFAYNSKSELTTVTDPNNASISYRYDLWGNLIETKNSNGQSITTSFDVLGRKIKLVDPHIGTIEYKYDEFDRLISETTNGAKEITLSYDKLARITKKKLPEGEITWKYDSRMIGLVDTIIDYHGNIKTYTYNNLGQVVSETQCIDNVCHSVSYTYDSLSRISVKKFPSGYSIQVGYINNMPAKLFERSPSGKLKEIFRIADLNANAQVTNKVYGNGIRTKATFNPVTNMLAGLESFKDPSYKFSTELKICLPDIDADDFFIREFERPVFPRLQDWTDFNWETINPGLFLSENRLAKSTKTSASPRAGKSNNKDIYLQDFTYSYDQNYNVSRINDLVKNNTGIFLYDNLNRLTKHETYSTGDTSSRSIRYDNFGNLMSRDGAGHYTYDNIASQRVISINGPENHEFRYDDFGNLTEDRSSGLILKYTSFNKPSGLSSPKAGLKLIKYGYENEEIKSELYRQLAFPDSNKLVLERLKPFPDYEIVYDTEARVSDTIHYITFAGDLILIRSSQSGKRPTNQFVHKDQLGSIQLFTDDNGTVISENKYDPFGTRNQTQEIAAQKGYTAHEHLDDFGLLNMGGRYYMPSIARFVSADPFIQSPTNLQSLNRYSYVMNNPTNAIDPSGFITFRGNWSPGRAVEKGVNNFGRELKKAGQEYIDVYKNAYNEGDRFVNKYGKQIVIIAAAAAITYLSGGSMAGFGLALLQGAAVGAGMSAGMTAYHGGSFQDILNASYGGAINGAASGALFNGVGDAFANTNTSFGSSGYFAKVGAHGAAGGVTSEASGGTFKDGFLSASISQALTPANEKIFGTVAENPENKFARIAFSGTVGGLAAHASGGNVLIGTTTAVYGRWFNDESHPIDGPAFRQGTANERPMSEFELDNYRELQFERGYSQGIKQAWDFATPYRQLINLFIGRGSLVHPGIKIQGTLYQQNQNPMY